MRGAPWSDHLREEHREKISKEAEEEHSERGSFNYTC